jgi:uncharacterized membrane protein (TIGR02234 family)
VPAAGAADDPAGQADPMAGLLPQQAVDPFPDLPEVARPSRRALFVTTAVVAAGAALTLIASGRQWAHAHTSTGLSTVSISVTGHTLTAVPDALAFVALAGAVALLATKGVGRQITALLLALAGGGTIGVVINKLGHLSSGGIDRAAVKVTGSSHPRVTDVAATAWPYLALVGGVLIAVGGLVAVYRGARWPGLSARYGAPGQVARKRDAGTPRELWDAVDRGEDPTL